MKGEKQKQMVDPFFMSRVLRVGIGFLTLGCIIGAWISKQNKKVSGNVASPSFDVAARLDIAFYI